MLFQNKNQISIVHAEEKTGNCHFALGHVPNKDVAVAQRICKFHGWQLALEDGIRTYCKGHILKLCGATIFHEGMAAQRTPKTQEMLLKLMPRVQKLIFPLDLHLGKALQDLDT